MTYVRKVYDEREPDEPCGCIWRSRLTGEGDFERTLEVCSFHNRRTIEVDATLRRVVELLQDAEVAMRWPFARPAADFEVGDLADGIGAALANVTIAMRLLGRLPR